MVAGRRQPGLISMVMMLFLTACSLGDSGFSAPLYVQQVTEAADQYRGRDVTVDGAYVWRPGDPGVSVLALGVSTLDNGLDAQPLGDVIWLEGFPAEVTGDLHQPGDAVYGFVRVQGRFEADGGYGAGGAYQYRLVVTQAEAIEKIRRVEQRISDADIGADKVSLFTLADQPADYNGQKVTTQGYYFWNGVIYVLAEGISTEEDGSAPQPIGRTIWMEGFPPDKSAELTVGPNNSYVWGLVEVTADFQTGGGFGRDGAYASVLFVQTAEPLEP
jgi:hypothetical protein